MVPIVLFLVKSLGLVKKAKKIEEVLKKKNEEKETVLKMKIRLKKSTLAQLI